MLNVYHLSRIMIQVVILHCPTVGTFRRNRHTPKVGGNSYILPWSLVNFDWYTIVTHPWVHPRPHSRTHAYTPTRTQVKMPHLYHWDNKQTGYMHVLRINFSVLHHNEKVQSFLLFGNSALLLLFMPVCMWRWKFYPQSWWKMSWHYENVVMRKQGGNMLLSKLKYFRIFGQFFVNSDWITKLQKHILFLSVFFCDEHVKVRSKMLLFCLWK